MNLKEHIVPVIGFVLILLAQVAYQLIGQNATIGKIVLVGVFSVLLYSLLLTLYTWFHSKPYAIIQTQKDEYQEFLTKIEASVNKLIQKQRFIDQTTLDLIEKQAQNIWVITTKLASELNNENLQKSVEANLKNDRKYTYFLPHPENTYFEDVDRNLKKFKMLPLYKNYKSNIRFIRLPIETQFLLEEVVIYNPDEEENKDDNTKGLNAFTFYESKDEETDSLHMKIEGEMLIHIRNRLEKYLDSTGLKFAAERILIEFSDKIKNENKLYVANLMNKREIDDHEEYNQFISKLNEDKISVPHVLTIDKILRQYMEK